MRICLDASSGHLLTRQAPPHLWQIADRRPGGSLLAVEGMEYAFRVFAVPAL
ncbi:MAG: hypothetical protein R3F11_21970 [Verrucomicrobiales bacterium]